MRKLFYIFSITSILILGIAPIYPISENIVHAQDKEIPPYAKWGQVAVKETIKKYPDVDLVDYLHRGRSYRNGNAIEHFKLWLRGKDKEFGVYVDIEFDLKTEKTLSIHFEETNK